MINLPILHSLEVVGYGLYPGSDPSAPHLHIDFAPGLTLVLGTNGLGKTTLVTMLYRLLTGPADVPALSQRAELGNANLEPRPLAPAHRRTFANRVSDNARNAFARVVFEVGGEEVSVERDLSDLTLRSCRVGDSEAFQQELDYRERITELANVSTFGDWIVLLRYIVFYFEDRRSLIWDPSAQRELLRILLLEPAQAEHWAIQAREILRADSEMRNDRVRVNREEQSLATDQALAAEEPEIRTQLQSLTHEQRNDRNALDELYADLPSIEAQNENARLRFLTLEQERESQYRALERARLLEISARMPNHSDTAHYILTQLLSEARCLVCGNDVPDLKELLESRINGDSCVICGSNWPTPAAGTSADLTDAGAVYSQQDLEAIAIELETARASLAKSDQERRDSSFAIQTLEASLSERANLMDRLARRLPPAESELHERWRDFSSRRARLEASQRELSVKHDAFTQIITDANAVVSQHASEVQNYFSTHAKDFLLENCNLVWSPQPAQLGQSGPMFDFPAFELDLGGGSFVSTVRRHGPDDVSESQREFIDISFRMALAKAGTQNQVASLVMDAPESSLDLVFVDRAARVLGVFGRPETGNRLVVTSNLVSGRLIPQLLKIATDERDRNDRVVDLLAVAAPTAAVREFRRQYEEARDELLAKANEAI